MLRNCSWTSKCGDLLALTVIQSPTPRPREPVYRPDVAERGQAIRHAMTGGRRRLDGTSAAVEVSC